MKSLRTILSQRKSARSPNSQVHRKAAVDPTRSRIMRAVRSKHTGPERQVRKLLWELGYRYRLHRPLPGKPDISIAKRRKAIFVHGCFWHRHPGCAKSRLPKTRREYWIPKLRKNVHRDARAFKQLQSLGWDVLVIWACTLSRTELVKAQLCAFLGPRSTKPERRSADAAPAPLAPLRVAKRNRGRPPSRIAGNPLRIEPPAKLPSQRSPDRRRH